MAVPTASTRTMTGSQENLAGSEADSEESSYGWAELHKLPVMQGCLCKWTNYVHGWQERFVVCKESTLSYYKTLDETSFGCRGALSLAKTTVIPHRLDECRFDIVSGLHIWYLRATSHELRQAWLVALDEQRCADSGYSGSENNLKRYDSLLSVTSGASQPPSIASGSSVARAHYLQEKINEMEHFREILCKQVDTLQSYFDLCANLSSDHDEDAAALDATPATPVPELAWASTATSEDQATPKTSSFFNFGSYFRRSSSSSCAPPAEAQLEPTALSSGGAELDAPSYRRLLKQHGALSVDFHGEAITFKATTAGVIAQLMNTLELMQQNDEQLRRQLDKEVERRRRIEDAYRALVNEKPKVLSPDGPDAEEGPGCVIDEDEFFDAFEVQFEKMQPNATTHLLSPSHNGAPFCDASNAAQLQQHPLYAEMTRVCRNHLESVASERGNEPGAHWHLGNRHGEMKVYHREVQEADGTLIHPLLAVHSVQGFTAHEICEIFWNTKYRQEWEEALESAPQLLETVSAECVVLRQVYKRMWPAAQRDAVFWSRLMRCPDDTSMVVNNSTSHAAPPLPADKSVVRLKIDVALICQTMLPPGVTKEQARRDQLTCKIRYMAYINPGGWAPIRAVREIARREGPKFIKRFTKYVAQMTHDRPIQF